MRTQVNTVRGRVSSVVRVGGAALAVLFACGLSGADLPDLKTFGTNETYMADGISIELTKVPGEVTVKFRPEMVAGRDLSVLRTRSGARFNRVGDIPGRFAIYTLESDAPVDEAASRAALDSLLADASVEYAYPVYFNAESGLRHRLTDEIVVRLNALFDPKPFSLKFIDTLDPARGLHVLKLTEPKAFNPFRVSHALRRLPEVIWADPNRAQEVQRSVIPNDPLLGNQWHLRNTGQTAGTFVDADVDAELAWDGSQGYGSTGVRIAILDDGVETNHVDLRANIVAGYDFYGQDSDPNPGGSGDNHGTAVAGVAAAMVNTAEPAGVAGVAGGCKILPVRIGGATGWCGATELYRALRYAADNADILSCSWGTDPNATIAEGFAYALSNGRGGRGCPVFAASGNSACGYGENSYNYLWSVNLYQEMGNEECLGCYVCFDFYKGNNTVSGANGYWLADVTLPDGRRERFDGPTSSQWSLSGWWGQGPAWTGSLDPEHAHGTTLYAWRSGVPALHSVSSLISPAVDITAQQTTLTFRRWVDSAVGNQAIVGVLYPSGQLRRWPVCNWSGSVAGRVTDVGYPANLSGVLAVGASTDFDYRSAYSQYGSALAFVTPSSGGYAGITTTDRTGSAGYEGDSNYFTGFGGTSSATPLAAGIGALVLSKDGNQSRTVVADKLIQGCDKVNSDSVPYTGSPSRNDY